MDFLSMWRSASTPEDTQCIYNDAVFSSKCYETVAACLMKQVNFMLGTVLNIF